MEHGLKQSIHTVTDLLIYRHVLPRAFTLSACGGRDHGLLLFKRHCRD